MKSQPNLKFFLCGEDIKHCGGSESDKSQERTDLLSGRTGLNYLPHI